MQLNKHQILRDIHSAMGDVEELGCSEELTALVIKLGKIGDMAESLVDLLACAAHHSLAAAEFRAKVCGCKECVVHLEDLEKILKKEEVIDGVV